RAVMSAGKFALSACSDMVSACKGTDEASPNIRKTSNGFNLAKGTRGFHLVRITIPPLLCGDNLSAAGNRRPDIGVPITFLGRVQYLKGTPPKHEQQIRTKCCDIEAFGGSRADFSEQV